MSRERRPFDAANPFSMHLQKGWEERAASTNLPDWLRVTALAYAKHRANGHAVFGVGDVAAVLMRVDKSTGVVTLPSGPVVSRAIKSAVENGLLAKGSRARCLIVPSYVTGGLGAEFDACPIHSGGRTRAPERELAGVKT